MSTIYLLNYNNYYNRTIKRENSLADYMQYVLGDALQNINFNPSNFIDTTQIINWDYDIPDYLIEVDEYSQIKSRWFVVDSARTRARQLRLTLHRDVIVDYYKEIVEAPCFIEKATLSPENNLIFNSEDMTFNQIKQKEIMLSDDSECPWICIYAARKDGENITTFHDQISNVVPIAKEFSEDEFNQWNLKIASDNGTRALNELTLRTINFKTTYTVGTGSYTTVYYQNYTISRYNTDVTSSYVSDSLPRAPVTQEDISAEFIDRWNDLNNSLSAVVPVDSALWDDMSTYNNQYIQVNYNDGTKKLFQVIMFSSERSANFQPINGWTTYGSFGNLLYQIWRNIIQNPSNFNPPQFSINFDYTVQSRSVIFRDASDLLDTVKYTITSNRFHLTDAPYDMFCMPYSDNMTLLNTANNTEFKTVDASKVRALSVANSFIATYRGANQVYDVQILPYCPLTNTIITKTSSGKINFDLNESNPAGWTIIDDEDNVAKGVIFHVSSSSFTRDLILKEPIEITDYKIQSECDLYRLCSPNYNGVFEFNAAKNGGLSIIHVQCTYKPFMPYIKLYPDWGRLYGTNFSEGNFDARGLICGGDFSLSMINDAWSTYELQNKNYQLSFDRQIQNLEIKNNIQRTQDILGSIVGTAQGAASGASSGAMFGPVGIGIGAGVGALTSAAGGVADIIINEKLRNENLDYTKDQFGYQLGNIKALPQSLSKVSAYTIDNKFFPFLEYYTCSSEERQALKDKIKYNGMTVMVIGKLSQYIQPEPTYIKGKLIRAELAGADYHIVKAIADELYKGVFI